MPPDSELIEIAQAPARQSGADGATVSQSHAEPYGIEFNYVT